MNVITQICLALAAVLLGLALLILYLKVRQYRTCMEALAKAVDGRPEMVSTMSTRIYLLHGSHKNLKYRCSYKPAVKPDPPEFAISFYGTFPTGLTIRRRGDADPAAAKTGGMEELRSGDPDFDKVFIVKARQGHSARTYFDTESRRAGIARFLDREGASLYLEGGSARAVFRGLELSEITPQVLADRLDRIPGLAV